MIVTDLSNSFNPCPKQKVKEKQEEVKVIKKKSNKLAKLERQRDKKIVKYGECEYCHRKFKHLDPHEVYGGSNRKRSMTNGFVKMLCRECHSNNKIVEQLKIDTQKEFEKTHTREEFIKIVGQSFIGRRKRKC